MHWVVSYLVGQGGTNKYAVDIGGNFLCVVDSGACRCVRHRRLDLALLRDLDHLSHRATCKWPWPDNVTDGAAEDVSGPELEPAGEEAPAVLFLDVRDFTPFPAKSRCNREI